MTNKQGAEWSCAQWQGKEIIVTFAGDGATVTGKMIDGNETAGWLALAVNPNSTRLVVYLHAVRSIQLASQEDEEEWQRRFMQTDAKPNSEAKREAEDRDEFYRDGPDGGGES